VLHKVFYPEGVAEQSPGLPAFSAGYPGVRKRITAVNPVGVADPPIAKVLNEVGKQPLQGWALTRYPPRVARKKTRATLGFAPQPLRGKEAFIVGQLTSRIDRHVNIFNPLAACADSANIQATCAFPAAPLITQG